MEFCVLIKIDENKKKLWKQAIKWPLYSVAIIPVFITGAYLLNQYEKIKIYNLIAFTLAAILIFLKEFRVYAPEIKTGSIATE